MEILKKEVDAKSELLAVMKKNKLTEYSYENKDIRVTEKEDVKVKSKKIKEGINWEAFRVR